MRKGVILAGGMGTRLHPLTKVTNKHLLPVYRKPIIHYPIEMLVKAGIEEVLIVTGGESVGDFLKLLGDGSEFGLQGLTFTYQAKPGGIAEALALARTFVGNEKFTVVLGDNIIEKNIRKAADAYRKQSKGAKIFLKKVPDPEKFGVAEVQGDRIVNIVEKPKQPKTDLAVVGIYMFDASVFEVIPTLQRSGRGELEITDVNNAYIRRGEMTYEVLDGWWMDAGGSHEDLWKTNELVSRTGANNG